VLVLVHWDGSFQMKEFTWDYMRMKAETLSDWEMWLESAETM